MLVILFLSTVAFIFGIYITIAKALAGTIKKKAATIAFFALTLFYAALYIFQPEYVFENIFAFSGIAATLLLSSVTIKGCSKKQLVYIAILILGLNLTIGTFAHWVDAIIFEGAIDGRVVDVLTNSVLLIVFIIAGRKGALAKLALSIMQLRKLIKAILLFSVWLCALLTSLLHFLFIGTYYDSPGFAMVSVLSGALIILIGIMCPVLIINNISNSYYKNLSIAMGKQVKAQVEHYEAMSRKNEDIKRFRHDYNNFRLGLIASLRRNDIAAVLTLLEVDETSFAKFDDEFKTGSIILDALLNEKKLSASKKNTSIEFEGIVPGELLHPIDICLIFGNALDNAIEACAKHLCDEGKIITIKSSYTRGFLFITIENPVTNDIQIVNNTIATTKSDKSSHGMGLHSIRTSVDKYNGEIKLSCENGIFRLEADLEFSTYERQKVQVTP